MAWNWSSKLLWPARQTRASIPKAGDMTQGPFDSSAHWGGYPTPPPGWGEPQPPKKSHTLQLVGGIVTFAVVLGLFLYGYYAGIIPRIGGATPSATAPGVTGPVTTPGPQTPTGPSPFVTPQTPHTAALTMDTVTAFFAPVATGDDHEQDRLELLAQATELMDFLATAGVDLTTPTDPMIGAWDREEFPDYLTFDGHEFYWYYDGAGTTDNFQHGEYLVLPGCYYPADYSTTMLGRRCYSIQLRYMGGMRDGRPTDEVTYDYLMLGDWKYTFMGKLWGPQDWVDLVKR